MDYNKNKYDFNDLFILEIANNHQGDIEHGKKIISRLSEIAKDAGVKAAIKFQFRDLDTFIHSDYKESTEFKHIPRFLSTRLSHEEFAELIAHSKQAGLRTMATPFDEPSVDLIKKLDVELIKIASCSSTDWPLLEKVSKAGKPVVCSTSGLRLKQVDNLVSFFEHKGVDFALLHCVSLYPTPDHKLNLQRIHTLKKRYPNITIGFSTHEDPSATEPVMLAYAKGARIFEKHVGLTTDEITLNDYSATPEQAERWLEAYNRVKSIIGSETNLETPYDKAETGSLQSLMRGVYVNKAIKKGEVIKREDVFFAMPLLEDQMPSGKWHEAEWQNATYKQGGIQNGLVADKDYAVNMPINKTAAPTKLMKKEIIYRAVHEIKALLNIHTIAYNHDVKVVLVHPIGIKHFFETGSCYITCIENAVIKKLIVLLPGQTLSRHYHTKKNKKLQILDGVVEVELQDERKKVISGEVLTIPSGEWHSLHSQDSAIIEELSTHEPDDVVKYMTKEILDMQRPEMQTQLKNWGRHQFDNDTTTV